MVVVMVVVVVVVVMVVVMVVVVVVVAFPALGFSVPSVVQGHFTTTVHTQLAWLRLIILLWL